MNKVVGSGWVTYNGLTWRDVREWSGYKKVILV